MSCIWEISLIWVMWRHSLSGKNSVITPSMHFHKTLHKKKQTKRLNNNTRFVDVRMFVTVANIWETILHSFCLESPFWSDWLSRPGNKFSLELIYFTEYRPQQVKCIYGSLVTANCRQTSKSRNRREMRSSKQQTLAYANCRSAKRDKIHIRKLKNRFPQENLICLT